MFQMFLLFILFIPNGKYLTEHDISSNTANNLKLVEKEQKNV